MFVDRLDVFRVNDTTFMFWWCTISSIVDLVVIQRHKLLNPFNHSLTPQDMITGEGFLGYLDQTVSMTIDCLFYLQTILLHSNKKNWKCELDISSHSHGLLHMAYKLQAVMKIFILHLYLILWDMTEHRKQSRNTEKNTCGITLKSFSFLIPTD